MRATAAIALFLLVMLVGAPAELRASLSCTFTLGFKAIHDQVPDIVGDCLADAAPKPNGDVQQPTANGLLVWRKADNWVAFTNGAETWVNGPFGLESRLNTRAFAWEMLQGFPGVAMVPPSWLPPFTDLVLVEQDSASYELAYGDPYYGGARVRGNRGRAQFDQRQQWVGSCGAGALYCAENPLMGPGPPTQEVFRGLRVGDSSAIVTHSTCCNGMYCVITWYDTAANMTYEVEMSGDTAASYGESITAGNRASADVLAGVAGQFARLE
jgi:hypothetical protein